MNLLHEPRTLQGLPGRRTARGEVDEDEKQGEGSIAIRETW